MDPLHQTIATVDIPSDDDDVATANPPAPPLPNKPRPPAQVLVLDDDDDDGGGPTPRAPPRPPSPHSPAIVPETPFPYSPASRLSIVRCSFAREPPGNRVICLESDEEVEGRGASKVAKDGNCFGGLGMDGLGAGSSMNMSARVEVIGEGDGGVGLDEEEAEEDNDIGFLRSRGGVAGSVGGLVEMVREEKGKYCCASYEDGPLQDLTNFDCHPLDQQGDATKKRHRHKKVNNGAAIDREEDITRKKHSKEEKQRLNEERRRKRQEERMKKEVLKAEAAEAKKFQKEKEKWEKGKFALKSIVAEIDNKVVESGTIGGHLLSRFPEKGLTFRITKNPMENSIQWKMSIPEQISQRSSMRPEVLYILFVYEAEQFCNMVLTGSLLDHVVSVQKKFPSYTICYLTNKLMSYINRREQSQYKNPSNVNCWKRPPVEELLSKLTTHFTGVHSRHCMDEAELSEHVVGLTSSLANCQYRTKSTWLSINANGSLVPKGFIDRHLIKKNAWLKALTAIPRVQPRFAIAIWKKYPTMRSLLNVYLDPSKSVHEKEFLLKDILVEGALGKEDRRLGDVCSKRVYRILMARNGGSTTDDVENGADLFSCRS